MLELLVISYIQGEFPINRNNKTLLFHGKIYNDEALSRRKYELIEEFLEKYVIDSTPNGE